MSTEWLPGVHRFRARLTNAGNELKGGRSRHDAHNYP